MAVMIDMMIMLMRSSTSVMPLWLRVDLDCRIASLIVRR